MHIGWLEPTLGARAPRNLAWLKAAQAVVLVSRGPLLLLAILLASGCDPQRKNKCEWYLVPNPQADHLGKPGWISLCVANFEIGRQKCYFIGKPELVEKFNKVPFRYSSMRYSDSFPREIEHLELCQAE